MSEGAARVDAATVSDRRPVPRGVVPRGMQTWLMVGVTVGMLVIILMSGRAEPPTRTAAIAASASVPANADRVREYQDRLRVLEARTVQEAQAQATATPPSLALRDGPPTAPSQDPLVAERKRRQYESLFASNVVLSRRDRKSTRLNSSHVEISYAVFCLKKKKKKVNNKNQNTTEM